MVIQDALAPYNKLIYSAIALFSIAVWTGYCQVFWIIGASPGLWLDVFYLNGFWGPVHNHLSTNMAVIRRKPKDLLKIIKLIAQTLVGVTIAIPIGIYNWSDTSQNFTDIFWSLKMPSTLSILIYLVFASLDRANSNAPYCFSTMRISISMKLGVMRLTITSMILWILAVINSTLHFWWGRIFFKGKIDKCGVPMSLPSMVVHRTHSPRPRKSVTSFYSARLFWFFVHKYYYIQYVTKVQGGFGAR